MVNNTNVVKKANHFLVFDTIRAQKSITVEGIISQTGLSRPTVLSILKELIKDNIIEKAGFAQQSVGRQPVLYSINSSSYYAMGIDVDVPPTRLAISNLSGELVYATSWEIPADSEVDFIENSLVTQINLALENAKIPREKVLGIGMGLPAIVDISKNKTACISRLHGWVNIPIDIVIKKRTGLEVYVRNDAHLLGIAEQDYLGTIDNLLYVVHRSGIGMAVVLSGKLYEGKYGNSGYIGHSTINADGPVCECGNRGCLELYCSKRAILDQYYNATKQRVRYSEFMERASQNDTAAIEILKMAGRYFGLGIANAIKMFDIPTVVIGDLQCDTKHIFFKSIVNSVTENTQSCTIKPPKILLGKLTEDQFGLGGCHFVLQKFFKSPKLRLKAK